MNDIMINWKKISKGMPAAKSYSDDRVPTMAEIHQLLEHPDRRIKIIVLVMISSGIRVGSWDYLQWKHVVPIERNNNIIAAKLIIKNTKIHNRTHYSFITPKAYFSLKDWMDFRKLHEVITSPRETTYNALIDILQKTDTDITLEELCRRVSDENSQIAEYLGKVWSVEHNHKLRPIVHML